MRFDAIAANGNPHAITPELDRMASEGINFKEAYVTTAICAISRASILSGQYERRHGIDDFGKSFGASALANTYPALLRENGYFTGFIGKYGVGSRLPDTIFDYWKGFGGHGAYFYKDTNGQPVHETAWMGARAEEFIRNRDPEKPFCLSISFKAPHSEDGVVENNGFRPDPYFDDWYTGIHFPYPLTYDSSYYLRFSSAWRKDSLGRNNEARIRWDMRFSTPDKFQTTYKAIYRLVSGLDRVLGQLRKFLKENNLEKNTILVFTSDNGYYMGEHGLEGKWYGHQESIHVPLIIYDPRLPDKGLTNFNYVLNIDFAPTILDWAGVRIPATMQGRSLAPLLKGNEKDWRREFFYEHRYDPGTYPVYIPHTVGVITEQYKYMRYYRGESFNSYIYEELFDRNHDPHEANNLISKQELRSVADTLRERISFYEDYLK